MKKKTIGIKIRKVIEVGEETSEEAIIESILNDPDYFFADLDESNFEIQIVDI